MEIGIRQEYQLKVGSVGIGLGLAMVVGLGEWKGILNGEMEGWKILGERVG